MTKKEANEVLQELNEVRPEKLVPEAKRLFDAIMKIADERDELKKMLQHRIAYCHKLEQDLFENCSNYVVTKKDIKAKIKEYDGLKIIDKSAYDMQVKPLKELLKNK